MKFSFFTAIAVTFLFVGCKKDEDNPPVADFTYTGAGVAPATVTFTNTSLNAHTYSWDFGDNTSSTSSSPSHMYTKGGVFTVKLTATGSGGTHSTTKTVNITAPTTVKVTAIKVLEMPFTMPGGGGWDNNSGPDVFYTIEDASDNVLLSSPTYQPNVTSSSLPITFSVTPPFQPSSFNSTYKVKIWDYDGDDFPPNPDDYIGGYSFNFSIFAATGYPATGVLYVAGGSTKIELSLTWQ